HAGHTLGLAGVKRLQLGAENGAAGYDGILHAGDTRIDAEFGPAIRLVGAFKSTGALADDGEVVGVFERDGVEIRDGQFRGFVGELTVSQEIVARTVQDATVFGDASIAVDAPTRGGRSDEHLARGGPGSAHGQPASGDTAAAARAVAVDVG